MVCRSSTVQQRRLRVLTLLSLGLAVGLCLEAGVSRKVALAAPTGGVERIRTALEILEHVPSGKLLLQRARRFWGASDVRGLVAAFRWAEVSKTDAVLTRFFDPKSGQETRERKVTIFLKQDQSMENLVLDVAHELVHATSRPAWDPYDPQLTPGKYIHAAIEGDGGEVEAVMAECRVGMELSTQYGTSAKRCRHYLSSEQAQLSDANRAQLIERNKVRRDFYRVGKWNEELVAKLGGEAGLFPLLSPENPKLYSSTGHTPYPVALFREFEDITEIACRNSRKRIGTPAPGRKLAAVASNGAADDTSLRFLAERCKE